MTMRADEGQVPEWTMGDRLRKARSLTGMTVAQFAAASLISAKSINNYEADKYPPKLLALKRWAEVTGVSEAWLLGTGSSVTHRYRIDRLSKKSAAA